MGAKNVETQVADELANDLFSAAFDEAVAGEPEETPPVEPAAEEPPPDESVAEVVTPEEKAAPVQEPVDVAAIVAATIAATKPKEEPAQDPAPETKTPTAEELAAEEQFRKDWPEHAAREDRLKAQLEEIKNLLVTTTDALKGQIQPVIETANMTAQEKHVAAITAAHADAFDIVPDVEKWIGEKPAFMQPALTAVLDTGTAQEVVDLFNLFKKESGAPPQTVDPQVKAAEQQSAATAARLKKMEVVGSVRTSITAETDPDDFDSAFDAEAKRLAA